MFCSSAYRKKNVTRKQEIMKKNQQILVLNTFAIIMVCVGHSFTAVESYYGHKWIYSFHMPLFMFISGYLLNYVNIHKQQTLSDISLFGRQGYIVKRAIRLLVPYFVISSITFIPKALLSTHALRPIDFSIDSYIHMLLYPIDNVIKFFWFLPTLFVVSIFTIILYKASKKLKLKYFFLICFPLFILLYEFNPLKHIDFLNLGGVASYLIFFISGCMYAQYNSMTSSKAKSANIYTASGLLIIYSALIYFIAWDTPFIGIVYAFTGIAFSFSLCSLYVKYNLKFLDHLSNSSYAIYLFSWYPLVIIQSFLMKKYALDWKLWAIISTILQIYIPFYIYKGIIYIKNNKHYGKTIATLLGQ